MDIVKLLRQAYSAYRKRKNWQRFVRIMAMIVVFCTTYALILPAITLERAPECGLSEHIHDEQCYDGTVEVASGHTHSDTCYTNTLICGQEESEEHPHSESCYQSTLICTLTEDSSETTHPLICELPEHTHGDLCYPEIDPEATTESDEQTPEELLYTGSSDDGILAQVALDAETTIPADAEVVITPVTAEDSSYADYAAQVDAVVDEQILGLTLLDISFFDTAGEYLSVEDPAQVTLTFEGMQFAEHPIKVFHFVDGAAVELDDVFISHATVSTYSLRDTTGIQQTDLTFQTDGFSVFGIVSVPEPTVTYEQVTDDPAALSGEFYITCHSNTCGVLNTAYDTTALNYSNTKIGSAWTFEQVSGSTYKIHSNGNYMVMSDGDGSNGVLTLTTEAANATVFTVGKTDAGYYTFFADPYYLNEHGGHGNMHGFKGWHQAGDGSQLILYRKNVDNYAKTLNGQSYAIVNVHGTAQIAMSATAATEQESSAAALAAIPVTTLTRDGVNYFNSTAEVPLWTFTAETDGSDGRYKISTEIGTGTVYLNLVEDATSGALTTSTTPQVLTVTLAGDGKVYIGNGTTSINASGSDDDRDFWCYQDTGDNNKMLLCQKEPFDSVFTVTVNGCTFTVHLQDMVGNPLYATRTDYTVDEDAFTYFTDLAPAITDYTYQHALFENNQVLSVRQHGTSEYRLYGVNYGVDGNSSDYYTRGASHTVHVYLLYLPTRATLNYNLNSPSPNNWIDDDYNDVPSITGGTTQNITDTPSTLHTVAGRNAENQFILRTLANRGTEEAKLIAWNSTGDGTNPYTPLDAEYMPPGAEYQFLYWKANNTDGTACYFAEDAPVYLGQDGYVYITDTDGTEQKLNPGTTLVGQWKMVSNVILFYVNHGDTMLEGEDNQAVTRFDSEYYTEIAAIGHIYNIDNPNAFSRGTIQQATHVEIMSLFRATYDPNSPDTQLVVDFYKKIDGTNKTYELAENYSEDLLEASIAVFIQSQTGKTIELDGAILDKEDITPENYMLYWYSMKLVPTDANSYHMDGVLVAKTQTMEIYKTFSGLTREEAETAIGTMDFPLYLLHTTTDSDGNSVTVRDSYLTLEATGSQTGVYTSDGWQSATSNIYKWTLESVQGQRYAFEETGYEIDGKECSSLVSVHYTDGTIDYRYQDATFTDLVAGAGQDDVVAITDLYAGRPLEGGTVESIVFANFYTDIGTGAFSISKVADQAGQIRLAGATFTLTDNETQTVYSGVTNENGAVAFADLPAGTYTLQETAPPPGYQKLDQTWQVVVKTTEDGTTDSSGATIDRVTVTIYEVNGTQVADTGTLLYDNGSTEKPGIQDVYLIQNAPEDKTLTINTVFSNITETELASLTGYCIELQDSGGTVLQTLTLADATPITGIMNGYTWTVTGLAQGGYQLVEKGFVHNNYLDVVVTAAATETGETASSLTVTKSSNSTVATVPLTKGDKALTVDITNSYTNTFTLKIKKVDATNSNAPMEDVQFKIYGEYGEGGGESITYTDDTGITHTVYLVGTVTTGTDGTAQFDGMKLSSGSRSFLYVIDEVATPDGYVKLSEPIVRSVDIDSQYYQDGVYTLTIENMQIDQIQQLKAMVTVTATKAWNLPADIPPADYPDVTLHLYRRAGEDPAEDLGSVTLDGTNNSGTTSAGVAYTITDGWTVTWSGLPYAAEGSDIRYEYYVAEDHIPGYNTTYSTYLQTLTLGTGQVQAAQAKDSPETQLKRQITVTNTTGYELPDTGGFGTWWYSTFGFVLILSCIWLYWRGQYKKKRGGADTS